ncbi:macrolide efflux ABC transporter membrane-spanning permease [Streptococcus pneumoniae]|nr:macrolide efflux ABC transporter membrane-spanning permease [Streptococcus pneumoniae]
MNRYAVQLISRGAINKMGNMLYDYGNSVSQIIHTSLN